MQGEETVDDDKTVAEVGLTAGAKVALTSHEMAAAHKDLAGKVRTHLVSAIRQLSRSCPSGCDLSVLAVDHPSVCAQLVKLSLDLESGRIEQAVYDQQVLPAPATAVVPSLR